MRSARSASAWRSASYPVVVGWMVNLGEMAPDRAMRRPLIRTAEGKPRKAFLAQLREIDSNGIELDENRSPVEESLQLVSITDAGRQVVDEVDHMAEELGTEYRIGLTRSERLQLVPVLQRLRDNLRRMGATSWQSRAMVDKLG